MSTWNHSNPRFQRTRSKDRPYRKLFKTGLKLPSWRPKLNFRFFQNFATPNLSSWTGFFKRSHFPSFKLRGIPGTPLVLVFVGLLVIAATWYGLPILFQPQPVPISFQETSPDTLPQIPELPPGSMSEDMAWRSTILTAETTIPEGGTFSQALENLGISRAKRLTLINLMEESQKLVLIRPGSKLKAWWNSPNRGEGDLERLEYHQVTGGRPLVMMPSPEGFFFFETSTQPIFIDQTVRGVIENTFWEAAEKADLEPRMIMNLIDLLASQIDFISDIKTGDSFQFLFRQQYQDGYPKGNPIVEVIQMFNAGEKYEFYLYEDPDGESGFFDASGRSMKKAFFKSPLQFSRISSNFTSKRFHPIHKVVRPHLGVDYAAPAHTPVSTVADGVVQSAGRRGGFGLLVVIDHTGGYQSYYAHLSKIAKGITPGAQISQGDLIGYVGSTGTASGPHLDFRIKYQSSFVDPVSLLAKMEGPSLANDKKPIFYRQITNFQTLMTELSADLDN